MQGLLTDLEIPNNGGNFYICGPELMMNAVAEKLIHENVDPSKIYVSMERYMKCAVGICGNCEIEGYRVCADGPGFNYKDIGELPKHGRTRTGELE